MQEFGYCDKKSRPFEIGFKIWEQSLYLSALMAACAAARRAIGTLKGEQDT